MKNWRLSISLVGAPNYLAAFRITLKATARMKLQR